MRDKYTPEWARDDSPTKSMNESAARDYWKSHAVQGDARFALRDTRDNNKPQDLSLAWAVLLMDVEHVGKETAEHRKRRDALRSATRAWLWGRPYSLLVMPVSDTRPKKTKHCPHCGGVL